MAPIKQLNRSKGQTGEDVACTFLVRKGYRIITRNWRKPYGEVDIIAEKNNIVRFVEVKSVSCVHLPDLAAKTDSYQPEELVHERKLYKIGRVADSYMHNKKDMRDYQIDVVAVFLHHASRTARCRLTENVC